GGVEIAPVAATLVGFAPPQVGQHRVAAPGDGPAVGFDGRKRLVLAECGVAAAQQLSVLPLPSHRLAGADGPGGAQGHHRDNGKGALQGGRGLGVYPRAVPTAMSARSCRSSQDLDRTPDLDAYSEMRTALTAQAEPWTPAGV